MAGNRKNPGKVTIYDVARAAGVSYGTVSRVINNNENVRPDTHKRVMEAMLQLGFAVNQQARHLAGGHSHMVGVILDYLDGNSYSGAVLKGILAELSEVNYELLIYCTSYRKTRETAYMATLTRGLADGFLLLIPENTHDYIEVLQQQNAPYVLIDNRGYDDPGPIVKSANRQGAYDATRYLIEQGHRRIGFITGLIDWGCAIERLDGYKAALQAYSLPIDQALIQQGNFRQGQGYISTRNLLELKEPPTAIFASNDSSAFGVMEAASHQGLRVPEDLSVIGFDDILSADQVHPALTTVRQPLEQMGRTAARLLLEYIQDPDCAAQTLTLPTELVIRGTVRSPRVK